MDYQSNSNKDKEKKERPPKNLEKVITGEVVQKPKSLGSKFKETFFGGDAKSAARFVTSDVLLPALRNLVVDAVIGGVERVIYGESRFSPRDRRPPTNYESRYRYTRSSPIRTTGRVVDERFALPDQRPIVHRAPKREFNDIILQTREDADIVVEKLMDILEKYDVVSMMDLYEILGQPVDPIDNKWGWTYLGNLQVRQIRDGYILEFPSLQEI